MAKAKQGFKRKRSKTALPVWAAAGHAPNPDWHRGSAVMMNEELAQALGINTRLVRVVTFCLGAGLASLAGALITPLNNP